MRRRRSSARAASWWPRSSPRRGRGTKSHWRRRLYAQFVASGKNVPLLGRERLWEVPFALRDPAAPPRDGEPAVVRRGTTDCLTRDAGGRITVLEFKTGRPRAEHTRQLDAYVAAARAMFPEAAVDGRLVYA